MLENTSQLESNELMQRPEVTLSNITALDKARNPDTFRNAIPSIKAQVIELRDIDHLSELKKKDSGRQNNPESNEINRSQFGGPSTSNKVTSFVGDCLISVVDLAIFSKVDISSKYSSSSLTVVSLSFKRTVNGPYHSIMLCLYDCCKELLRDVECCKNLTCCYKIELLYEKLWKDNRQVVEGRSEKVLLLLKRLGIKDNYSHSYGSSAVTHKFGSPNFLVLNNSRQ